MKIPVWLASVLVAAALGACGWGFDHLATEIHEMRSDITRLQVEVAAIKARVAPDLQTADARDLDPCPADRHVAIVSP